MHPLRSLFTAYLLLRHGRSMNGMATWTLVRGQEFKEYQQCRKAECAIGSADFVVSDISIQFTAFFSFGVNAKHELQFCDFNV